MGTELQKEAFISLRWLTYSLFSLSHQTNPFNFHQSRLLFRLRPRFEKIFNSFHEEICPLLANPAPGPFVHPIYDSFVGLGMEGVQHQTRRR